LKYAYPSDEITRKHIQERRHAVETFSAYSFHRVETFSAYSFHPNSNAEQKYTRQKKQPSVARGNLLKLNFGCSPLAANVLSGAPAQHAAI